MLLIHQNLAETALRFPKKTALIADSDDLTYEELVRKVDLLAGALLRRGMRPGARTLMLLNDKENLLLCCLAAMRAGLIAVPLAVQESSSSIEQISRITGASMLLTGRAEAAEHPLLPDSVRCSIVTFEEIDHPISGYDEAKEHSVSNGYRDDDLLQNVKILEEDGAVIVFGSRRSGQKQGAVFSHKTLIESTNSINELTGINSNLREYVAAPVTGLFGLGRCLSLLFAGGTIIVPGGATDPESITSRVLQNRCNGISSSSDTLSALTDNGTALAAETAAQIHFIRFDDPSMTIEHKKKLLQKFPHAQIWLQYGTTEAPCLTLIEYRSKRDRLQTVGRPASGIKISILDEEGNPIGRGRIGDIAVQGKLVAKGFWHSGHVDALSPSDDRMFTTSDVGFLDTQGYLHYSGRNDEVIHRKDTKILPMEVEEKIREAYPDCEPCVIGLPDPEGLDGEIPVLCYASLSGRTIIASELSNLLSRELDRNKIPRIVFRVDAFPRLENKISRFELRNLILDGKNLQYRSE